MSKSRNDGTAKKIRRGREDRRAESQPDLMGEIQDQGGEYRTDTIIASGEDSRRGDIDRHCATDASSDIGKILERLHLLEEEYVTYVKAHQGRLKARLDESEDKERKFRANAKSLESDILGIIQRSQ